MQRESDIQREIMQYLNARNIFCFRTPNITVNRRKNVLMRGVSDIIGIYKGKFTAIEVKTKNGKQSDLQKDFHDRVIAEGGISILARSVEDVQIALDSY